MSKHNFCYNYGFLADWLAANPNIKRKKLLESLEMSDYRTLHNWIEGLTMMPLTQMMRFCNIYNVSITAFFYDEFTDETSVFSALHNSAKIAPANGWSNNNRKVGIKLCDPRTNIHINSNMPEYVKNENVIAISQICENSSDTKLHEAIIDERMKLIDIIEKQNDMMLEMTREILTTH